MRLSFLLLALVAAATAVPQLNIRAGNLDTLKKQRDVLLLLQQVFQEIPNQELRNICKGYNMIENLQNYRDQGVVKYLDRAVKLGYIQRKGTPFTVSISKLRQEVAVLTRTLLSAQDYTTFLKTAAWARCHLNEAQFVKAFVATVLQRHDTKDIVVLPALYEVFPYYYFDARIIRKAQNLRSKCNEKTGTKNIIEIEVDKTAWLPKGEHNVAYFTQDIGLSSYYTFFSLAGWMNPHSTKTTDNINTNILDCDRCEIGRGCQYYYIHQQLWARYNLERLSSGLGPIRDADFSRIQTPFKPHLSYANGLEFPGRSFDVNLIPEKEHLIKTACTLERRLNDAIDSGFTVSTQGSILALYNQKGLDVLGNLIEATGRSINPRYYGCLQGVTRKLLGAAPESRFFFEPTPAAIEISHTALRDPLFYKLFQRIIRLFKRYQDSLPFYKENDIMLPGVTIEDVKFDRLETICDKFKVDIDSATSIPCDTDKQNIQIKAVVERLNHKPFNYNIIVQSEKVVKGAVVRVYIGPKYDFDGRYINIEENRLRFVELDQLKWDIKQGKTIITRNNKQAPMRSEDIDTKKDLLRKVEDALNSHQPFYAKKIPQLYGFPERFALPKGTRDGLTLQVVVIISSPKAKTMTYGPIVPEKYQTYQNLDFEGLLGDTTKGFWGRKYSDSRESTEDIGTTTSNEQLNLDEIRDRQFNRYQRSVDDTISGERTHHGYDSDTIMPRTSLETDTILNKDVNSMAKDYLTEYYKDKHTFEMIGGAISLDGRPLGYPFDRKMTEGCLWMPNLKIIDVKVFHDERNCKLL